MAALDAGLDAGSHVASIAVTSIAVTSAVAVRKAVFRGTATRIRAALRWRTLISSTIAPRSTHGEFHRVSSGRT